MKKGTPVRLAVTVMLEGSSADAWRHYVEEHASFQPSNGRLARSLIIRALALWEEENRKKSS